MCLLSWHLWHSLQWFRKAMTQNDNVTPGHQVELYLAEYEPFLPPFGDSKYYSSSQRQVPELKICYIQYPYSFT